ncbi:MAG TPA: GAF domain-containing protein, partial [Burkholderiaceae bacterium]|nr:GAF domain-containing protein [Burkholderiaceae bacterium]
PIVAGERALGILDSDNYVRENAFGEAEVRLLQTVASAMGVALENARLFDETQRLLKETEQRNAELAVINSIQQSVGAALDFQAIVDVVGDKLREVFDSGDMSVRWWDEASDTLAFLYVYEHGVRLHLPPRRVGPDGPVARFLRERRVWLLNSPAEQQAMGVTTTPGTDAELSVLFVPIVAGSRMLGAISLSDHERENAFDQDDVRLVSTIATSMGVALLNAKSYEAERQRAAELAIINAVQQALAGELDIQGVYDAVGDKLREVFPRSMEGIRIVDRAAKRFVFPYAIHSGRRVHPEPMPLTERGFGAEVIRTRRTLLVNENIAEAAARLGSVGTIFGASTPKALLLVPLIVSGEVFGMLCLNDMEREHAFSADDVRLLETLAASMSVALENARLFDETQRLFKQSEQRAAELAVINSVQSALAAELSIQGIYDAVGDKIREIFNGQDIAIRIFDPATRTMFFPYAFENGARIFLPPYAVPETAGGFGPHVLRTGQTLLINENVDQEVHRYGSFTMEGSQEIEKSILLVPMFVGSVVRGMIGLSDMAREHAFGEADVRLLQTLAGSMAVALENARLFDETQRLLKETEQRNAELAVINSIQQGLAANLDLQAVIDLVGTRLVEVFSADAMRIDLLDRERDVVSYPFIIDHGERFSQPPQLQGSQRGISGYVMRHRQALRFDTGAELDAFFAQAGIAVQQLGGGTPDESFVYAPLLIGEEAIGTIVIGKQPAHAFDDADVKLIGTIAASLSLALRNAQSFEAERQRNAELALINSVQEGIAGSLDFQGIVDLVGGKLREVMRVNDISIRWFDADGSQQRVLYDLERGERLPPVVIPMSSASAATHRLIDTRRPRIFNTTAEMLAGGIHAIPGTRLSKSLAHVPIIGRSRVIGAVGLEDYDREHAFGESDVRLLQTV